MTTIKEHLEKAKLNNDTKRVEQLEKVLSRGTLTFKEWVKSAVFIPVEEHKDYVEIIEYIGGGVIEVLSTGELRYKETKSTDLDTIEMILWFDIAEKLWCKTC
jgi:hypothetical protein